MNVNFNGYGENAATFIADKTITEAGVPVKMKDNGTVAKCDASENFCGVCVSVRGGTRFSLVLTSVCGIFAPSPTSLRLLSSSLGTDAILR